jgi:hypothetical protein
MKQEDLYQISKAKSGAFSELVRNLQRKVPDPKEDIIRKCTALINTTAERWKEENKLVQRGKSLGKKTATVWESQNSSLQEVSVRPPLELTDF